MAADRSLQKINCCPDRLTSPASAGRSRSGPAAGAPGKPAATSWLGTYCCWDAAWAGSWPVRLGW